MGGRKLGLPSDQRRALLRSLVSSLLWHDEIDTTEARAKEASRIAERVITLAKRNDLHSRRLVTRMIFEQNIPFQGTSDKSHRDSRNQHRLMRRLFEEIAPIYKNINGGYVRIIRLGPRRGD
ncbi:MAG: 50S ribosomal protein L17, partial [Chloroflexi bacterium]|nr:50S ribosomal protein L17 [Chloroflexota bacterium]